MLETLQKIAATDEVKMPDTGRQSAGNEAYWLAGFVDGEGSIVLAKRTTKNGTRFLPLITITNTHKETVEHIHVLLESLGIGHHIIPFRSKRYANAKLIYTIHINGFKRVLRFLETIGQHLFTKRRQAEIVHQFIVYRSGLENTRSVYSEVEFALREQLQSLNRFGSSETLRVAPASAA